MGVSPESMIFPLCEMTEHSDAFIFFPSFMRALKKRTCLKSFILLIPSCKYAKEGYEF